MRPIGAWFGRLAMAGACLAWAGCGRGDVPDPDSDTSAISEPSPKSVARGGAQAAPEAPVAEAPAAEAEPAARPSAPAAPEPAPAVASNPPAAEAEKPAAASATEAPAPAPAPAIKGDASGTEEMLRIGATPAATPAPGDPVAAATPGPGGSASPSMTAMPAGMPGATPAAAPGPGGSASSSMPAGMPGATPAAAPGPGGSASPSMTAMPAGMEGATPAGMPGATPAGIPGSLPSGLGPVGIQEGGGSGGFGGMGGPGGTNDPNGSAPTGPASYRYPQTAVMAFLNALTAHDKDRLSQATARRAPTESVEKHQKIFAAIVDQSISDDELEEMAKAMTGYQVFQVLQAKSTGRIGVVIAKMDGRDRLQRTLTVRKEKEGWKVMDISEIYDFKPGISPNLTGRGRRR